jgi:hypothetical protein
MSPELVQLGNWVDLKEKMRKGLRSRLCSHPPADTVSEVLAMAPFVQAIS